MWAGPDGRDAFSSHAPVCSDELPFASSRPLRIGWMTSPGLGPVAPEVAAVVKSAAEALQGVGAVVEHVGIPALEQDFALDVFNRIHVMEMKPAFAAATAGRSADELYKMAKTMLSLPDISMSDLIDAEQAAERLRYSLK